MDEKELIEQKRARYDLIFNSRKSIAHLKHERAVMKAPLWEEATGTVDAKKDYIKSKTAELDKKIAIEEANIELWYNEISAICDEIVYICDFEEE